MSIQFCPRCGSTNIETAYEPHGAKLPGHPGVPTLLRCKECSHTNHIFPEANTEKDLKKIQKKLKEK